MEETARMAIISGTSSCHIMLHPKHILIPGVWGPYPNVMIDGKYCTEGGQSITGKAIEIILSHHPHFIAFADQASQSNESILNC